MFRERKLQKEREDKKKMEEFKTGEEKGKERTVIRKGEVTL